MATIEAPADATGAPEEGVVVPAHVVLACPACHLRFAAVIDRARLATAELRCPYCRQSIGLTLPAGSGGA